MFYITYTYTLTILYLYVLYKSDIFIFYGTTKKLIKVYGFTVQGLALEYFSFYIF